MSRQEVDAVVIGAGQAGLAAGHHLARARVDFAILDGGAAIGDSWRRRWDNLRLFTDSTFTQLPGLPFPASRGHVLTKDEMADYLAAYAERFSLPVRLHQHVYRVSRDGDLLVAHVDGHEIAARAAIIATGAAHHPRRPTFAGELADHIVQLHSSTYRNADQLPEGRVLIVGAGNSGAEIAMDLSTTHEVVLAGRDTGRLPIRIGGPMYRFMNTVFRAGTPQGRWFTSGQSTKGTPLVRVTQEQLTAAGVERAARVAGVVDGMPQFEDGTTTVPFSAVIWCTGFVPRYDWIELHAGGNDGQPAHDRGVARAERGLYFVGLPYQYTLDSSLVAGVGKDAAHVVNHLIKNVLRGRTSASL